MPWSARHQRPGRSAQPNPHRVGHSRDAMQLTSVTAGHRPETNLSHGGSAKPCPMTGACKDQRTSRPGSASLAYLLTRPGGTGETTRDTSDAPRGLRLVSETHRDTRDVGDARRMAHNPEVAGSNPAPATKVRGPSSNREGAFCMSLCTDCARAPAQAARVKRRLSALRMRASRQ